MRIYVEVYLEAGRRIKFMTNILDCVTWLQIQGHKCTMSSVKDDAIVVNSQLRHSVSTLWFFLTFEFLISTFLSIFLAILTFIKSLLPKPPRDLTGDIILIAGVSSSLGESLASEFLKNGCSVICVDKDSKTIEETVSRLKQRHLIIEPRQRRNDASPRCGSMIFTYECDFLDKDAIRGTVQKVKKDIGRIDVLITCINESNENIFDVSSRTLMAHFWTVLTFLPMMLYQKRGHIIGVTPIALNSDAYHSSRAAIMYFIESMRQELSEHSSYLTFLAYSPIAKSSSLKQNEEEVSKNIVRAVKTDQYNVGWTFKLLYQIGCIIYNGITLLTNWIDFNRCDYPTWKTSFSLSFSGRIKDEQKMVYERRYNTQPKKNSLKNLFHFDEKVAEVCIPCETKFYSNCSYVLILNII